MGDEARRTHVVTTRYEKTCAECGGPFTARKIDARYCSGKCNSIAYQREHADQLREKQRQWTARNRAKTRETQQRWQDAHAEDERERKRVSYAEVSADPVKAEERRQKARVWYLENRERILEKRRSSPAERRASRRSIHGAEWDEFFPAMWTAQEGRCYLCGSALDQDKPKAIHIDHDHRCCPLGRSCERCRRGLACDECNRLIGIAHDDPDRLRRIADGLESAMAAVSERMRQPRKGRDHVMHQMQCAECGSAFTASRSDARFCSSKCYDSYRHRERRSKPQYPKTCQQCGADFMGASWARYCSKICSRDAEWDRKQARLAAGG